MPKSYTSPPLLVVSLVLVSSLVWLVPSHQATAQAVESMQERRAKEAAEARRKHVDDLTKHAQTWNRSKEQERASKRAEAKRNEREERLNEIAFIYGDLVAELPEKTTLINRPYPSEFELVGKLKPKYDLDSDIVGGIALKLNIKQDRKNKGDRAIVTNTIAPITQGDVLCLTFWAKAGSEKKDAAPTRIPELGVRRSDQTALPIALRSVSLTPTWEHFSFAFASSEEYQEGAAQIYFKVGSDKQKLELGPAYLFNLGQRDLSQATGRACRA